MRQASDIATGRFTALLFYPSPLRTRGPELRTRLSSARMRGSGTPRPHGSIIGVSGYRVARSSRAMTAEYVFASSRPNARALPETSRPLQTEGTGKAGYTLHSRPHVRRALRKRVAPTFRSGTEIEQLLGRAPQHVRLLVVTERRRGKDVVDGVQLPGEWIVAAEHDLADADLRREVAQRLGSK
jgi:hypothetical protein